LRFFSVPCYYYYEIVKSSSPPPIISSKIVVNSDFLRSVFVVPWGVEVLRIYRALYLFSRRPHGPPFLAPPLLCLLFFHVRWSLFHFISESPVRSSVVTPPHENMCSVGDTSAPSNQSSVDGLIVDCLVVPPPIVHLRISLHYD